MHSYNKDSEMKVPVPFSFHNGTLCCGDPGLILCHSSLILNAGGVGDFSKKTQGRHPHSQKSCWRRCVLSGDLPESP